MCAHHKQAQKQLDADDRARRTHYDPTADAAIARADRIENSAREYAAGLNPDRAKADPSLYQQLLNERYGRRKK